MLLHTTFAYHQYQGHTFFAPSSAIVLPRFIAQHIEAITGLDSFSQGARPHHGDIRTFGYAGQDNGCTPDPRALSASQVRQAYNLNQMYHSHGTGTGKQITIVLPEFNLYHSPDVQHYLNCVGFHGTIRTITVDHQAPLNYDLEPLIDLETIVGLVPDANIVIYQTDPGAGYSNF